MTVFGTLSLLIRNLIFSAFFLVWLSVMGVIGLPLLLLPQRVIRAYATWWAQVLLRALRILVGITVDVQGQENIEKLKGQPVLFASKHMSTWETFFLMTYLEQPAFILKRQLLWLPFYGWYVAKMGHVPIDRGGGGVALRQLLKHAKQGVSAGRPLVIFPQGTRVSPNQSSQEKPYLPGVAALYRGLALPVIPVALTSGLFWPRRRFLKKPGVIRVKFLPAISPGLEKPVFMARLETAIETETARLIEASFKESNL